MCVSRKYRYPPQGGFLEIPRRRGSQKPKFFYRKYETKLEFPEGGEFKQKTLHGSGMDIFWNNSVTNNPTTFHMIKCLGVILLLCP